MIPKRVRKRARTVPKRTYGVHKRVHKRTVGFVKELLKCASTWLLSNSQQRHYTPIRNIELRGE